MFRTMTCVVSLALLLVLWNSASAQTFWDGGGADHLWSTADNWHTNAVPGSVNAVSIDAPADTHCQIENGIAAECETLRVGNGSATTNLDISGGSLAVAGAYIGVDNPTGHGILNMSGGLFTSGALQLGSYRGTVT